MTFASCSTHHLFCVANRKCRKLTSEKAGLHSKEAKRREDRKNKKSSRPGSREENVG
jgi:hypothetical protein